MPRSRSIAQILLRGARRRARRVFKPDNLGNVVAHADAGGSVVAAYAYDALGRPVTRNLDEFGYNARGEVAWARYGTNTLADIYHYDFIGNFTSNRLRGAWSQFAANELNEYTFVAASNPRQLAYDAHGNIVEMNDSIGPESFFNYDVFGNSMNSVGISSRATQFGYSSKELLKIANLYD